MDRQAVNPFRRPEFGNRQLGSNGRQFANAGATMAQCGWLKGWRGEKFDICDQSGKPLCALERAAFRPFGLMSQAVHLNGLVETEDGLRFWIGRRSPHKAVDQTNSTI